MVGSPYAAQALDAWAALWLLIPVAILVGAALLSGVRYIPNNRVGVVEKLWSNRGSVTSGRIIALAGEAGIQADVLRGGLHFGYWFFQYRVHLVPLVTVPQGKIGYVYARDGESQGPSQALGRVVPSCNNFQDARAFLVGERADEAEAPIGQRGRQRQVLREGVYAVNLGLFVVISEDFVYRLDFQGKAELQTLVSWQKELAQIQGFSPVVVGGPVTVRDPLDPAREVTVDGIGIVAVQDGPTLGPGEIIAPAAGVERSDKNFHSNYQDPEAFLRAGGYRGRQYVPLTDGTYFINRWFANVEMIPKTVVPIGYVGAVVSYYGRIGQDVSGATFRHGERVAEGERGVLERPLGPGKYPFNTYAGSIILVPTTNFVLHWVTGRTEAHRYDESLRSIDLVTKDAYEPTLPLSVVVHIDYQKAPGVIQRFGDVKKLITQTLDPMLSAYFRDVAHKRTMLELLHNRDEIQRESRDELQRRFGQFDIECVDVLIGKPDTAEAGGKIETLLEQLRLRQFSIEQMETFDRQREAAAKQQTLNEAQAAAAMQAKLTASLVQVRIAENDGEAALARARKEAEQMVVTAQAESQQRVLAGRGEGSRLLQVGPLGGVGPAPQDPVVLRPPAVRPGDGGRATGAEPPAARPRARLHDRIGGRRRRHPRRPPGGPGPAAEPAGGREVRLRPGRRRLGRRAPGVRRPDDPRGDGVDAAGRGGRGAQGRGGPAGGRGDGRGPARGVDLEAGPPPAPKGTLAMSVRWPCVAIACGLSALAPALRAADPGPTEGRVRAIKVLADRAPDCSSLRSIVESVTRGCKTDDEKAIAVYNFMQLAHYHQGYPGEEGGLGALKEINVYGWSLCGGLHTVEAALWRELGWPWRYVGWSDPGHTTVEARYGGRWHYLDSFLKVYAWMPAPDAPGGRTIAGEEDIKADPALVTDGLVLDPARGVYYHKGDRFEVLGGKANWRAPSFLGCGDEPGGIPAGIRSSNRAGSPEGWAGLTFDSPGYSTDVDLAPGSALTLTWDPIPGAHWWNGREYVPGHGCGDKDYRNCPAVGPILEPYRDSAGGRRSHANGTLRFDPGGADLAGLAARENVRVEGGKLVPADLARPASITIALRSPYIMTRASGRAEGVEIAEISVDGGKTFRPVKLDDFSEQVGGKYACLVRLTFRAALAAPRLEAIVQCNRGALPYLSPGRNRISVAVADPRDLGANRLAMTYAYRPGSRSASYEEMAEAGEEVARAHHASWATRPTVVRKVFAAADLPATFDVDVPTPKGQHPVYPRMLFLRREVLAPGAEPLPLPEGAEAPRTGPEYELATLPDPFTVGIAPPPQAAARSTTTRAIPLRAGRAVSRDGGSAPNHYLKWKPGETWVMLVAGDLAGLPPAREIVAARLVIPVVRGHAKAATAVGVTLPDASIGAGGPSAFEHLGEVAGTVVVPRQPGEADYSPPRPFAADVTRAVKRIASGAVPFRGFAIRVVPDRAVDDGYITRIDLPDAAPPVLELDVYAESH